jgi:putative FmdB family regulatory protein
VPLFEYRCTPCSRDFELLVRAGEEVCCPECGTSALEKLFSEAAAPSVRNGPSLPISGGCPPADAPPCSPHCCRL